MKNTNYTRILLSLCLVALLLLTAVSCDKGDGNAPIINTEPDTTVADTTVADTTEADTTETEEETTVNACSHETWEWVVDKNATCAEEGSKHKECQSCKAQFEATVISTTMHVEETVLGKAAGCTEVGLTNGTKCSKCGKTLVEQEEIQALGHTEDDWIIDKIAEIGVDGSKHTECAVCGETLRTETIPAIVEDHVHQGKEWATITPATCTEKGMKAFVCSCGHTMETMAIAVAPHTEEEVPGRAATCTESGLTSGKACSVCDTVTVAQTVIPPTGHSFEDGTCLGCGISEPYGIWIVDGLGNPMTDIVVKVMKDGEQVKMYPYQGEFLAMNIETGTYQLVLDLSQLGEEYVYDESSLVVTPTGRTATVRLFKTPKAGESLFVGYPIELDYDSYRIGVGSTQVTLTPNDYTFFVFTPSVAAVYTVTYECPMDLAISYHGGSFFVQGEDLTGSSDDIKIYENGIALNVYASNIGAEYVLAVKSTSATSCVINIRNAGDPGTRIEDAPWTPYLEDSAKVEEQLNMTVSGTYTTVDLADLSMKAVYNEADGYYHLNSADGPILFIDLTSTSQFMASIQVICGNQRMGAYIYDMNGNITEKRSYNELFFQYGMPETAEEVVETPIRVPLTKKLAEAIQSFGDKNGWWSEGDTNIFTSAMLGAPYNQEYAWLLFCGYYA